MKIGTFSGQFVAGKTKVKLIEDNDFRPVKAISEDRVHIQIDGLGRQFMRSHIVSYTNKGK